MAPPAASAAAVKPGKHRWHWPVKTDSDLSMLALRVHGQQLNCVQYAAAYTQLPTKAFFAMMRTPETILDYFRNGGWDAAERHVQQIVGDPQGSMEMVDDEHFGRWMLSAASTSEARTKEGFSSMLLIHNHAMSVKLRWKPPKTTGEPRLCITYYDCRYSLQHGRLVPDSAESLGEQKLSTVIPMDHDMYGISGAGALWVSARAVSPAGSMPHFSLQPDTSALARSCAAALSQAMFYCSPASVEAVGKRLHGKGETEGEEISRGIAAIPGLSLAMKLGQTDKMNAFIDALAGIGLSARQLQSIVDSRYQGLTAHQWSQWWGNHDEAVLTYRRLSGLLNR